MLNLVKGGDLALFSQSKAGISLFLMLGNVQDRQDRQDRQD
ncbi:hypothetical protein SVI_0291 [Shewanella violacea DSS12]|uniref:Uncharacterized protein n=1 Tax=Shewanella violacea (strain JCM 10179 / CIP 106290 / LMG 19151 / DSS12) TaxID=637905 RepID=D4ZEN2_SHEVD|nr:hypothetical protein SVI_0291 [Shewanella violacea DSS12]